MSYVLEIGCVERLSLVSPLRRILREMAEWGSGPVRAEFWERPDCLHRCSVELGAATRVTERDIIEIIDELTDDVAFFSNKGHVVISAPDDVNENMWAIDAESAVPWEETALDDIAAMEGVAFVIHAHGDTIVSGDIDISAAAELPVNDYRYISGRIRPDRIIKAREP
jgi:hypothetical protein